MKYGGTGGHFGRMICICTGLVGPISSKYTFFLRILLSKGAAPPLKKVCNGAAPTVWEGVGGG